MGEPTSGGMSTRGTPVARHTATEQNCPPLLLVDGHNLLWRATFGFPAEVRSRDKSRVLTGVFGFFALLRVAVREELVGQPEIVVVFDGQFGASQRLSIDDAYKQQRPINAQALSPIQHLADVKRGLDALGIRWLEDERAEADDLIASLAQAGSRPGEERQGLVVGAREILIMSSDRDFYSILTSQVLVLNTVMRPGGRRIGPAEVVRRFGVAPRQWADFRALAGDPADNIPGVKGVGAKTAAALLAGGLTLDELSTSGRLSTYRGGAAVRAAWEQICSWRDMIRLRTDLPLPVSAVTGRSSAPLPRAGEVLERLGLG